ISRPPGFSPFR
nr:kinin T [Rattus norvegicus]